MKVSFVISYSSHAYNCWTNVPGSKLLRHACYKTSMTRISQNGNVLMIYVTRWCYSTFCLIKPLFSIVCQIYECQVSDQQAHSKVTSKYITRTSARSQLEHQQALNKDMSKHTPRTSASTRQGHQQALNKDMSKHTPRSSASTQLGHQQAPNQDISKHSTRSSTSTQ